MHIVVVDVFAVVNAGIGFVLVFVIVDIAMAVACLSAFRATIDYSFDD